MGKKILDSAKAVFLEDSLKNSKFGRYPLLIVDGQPVDDNISKKALEGFDPNTLIEIIVLKSDENWSDNTFRPLRDIVLLVTKSNAKDQIQKKFSAHSKKYKEYIAQNDKSANLVYVLNGEVVTGTEDEILKKLYDIPVKKIKSVSVVDKKKFTDMDISRSAVMIKTKG